jgi:ferredoxin--NADP+ reductase
MRTEPGKFQKAEIVRRTDCAEDLWVIRVRPEHKLVFKPGQYVTLGVDQPDHLMERAYSICSSPLEDEVEFFIELVVDGGLTPLLHKMTVGEWLWMRRQTKGLFTLDGAPYVSMVRTLAREAEGGKDPGVHLVVMQAASRSWEFAYREELEALAQRWNWLRYIPTVSRPWEDPEWSGEVGRAEDLLRKYIDSLGLEPSNTTAYVCGHPEMIENAKAILKRRGFSKEFVREELYWVLPQKQA